MVRASLGLAQELLRKNRIMVQVGTLAPLEIATAEASVADRQFQIISAEAAIGTAEDALRRLMGLDADSPSWQLRIVPIDEAEFHAAYVDPDETLAAALSGRSELEAARLAIATAEAVDRAVEGLSDAQVAANDAAGRPLNLFRAEHRREHLDEIEHALTKKARGN